MSVENVFSNENYINKDFQQVYREVVDTIGKLNNKYLVDGEGDENDPMVILIKCLAGAVDKLSYNTDKNIERRMCRYEKSIIKCYKHFNISSMCSFWEFGNRFYENNLDMDFYCINFEFAFKQ